MHIFKNKTLPFAIKPWLQLIRFPNLMTLPGDVIVGIAAAGALSASLFQCSMLILCSILLYMGGLILNDLLDFKEDLRERPDRPLPSGQIEIKHAWIALFILHGSALLIASCLSTTSFFLALSLVTLIVIYNGPAKANLTTAAAFMGACRANNILFGASLAGLNFSVWIAAIACGLYISAVTIIAYDETRKTPSKKMSQLPFLIIGSGLLATLIFCANITSIITILSIAGLAYFAHALFKSLINCPSPSAVPPLIGRLIRLLIPIQASFILIFQPTWLLTASLLWLSIEVSKRASKKFYAS